MNVYTHIQRWKRELDEVGNTETVMESSYRSKDTMEENTADVLVSKTKWIKLEYISSNIYSINNMF